MKRARPHDAGPSAGRARSPEANIRNADGIAYYVWGPGRRQASGDGLVAGCFGAGRRRYAPGDDPRRVPGYEHALAGHLDVARAVAAGFADVGVGIASAARLFGLDFISLRSERSSLLIRDAYLRHAGVAALLETLRSNAYRRDLEAFGPYDTQRTGEEIR